MSTPSHSELIAEARRFGSSACDGAEPFARLFRRLADALEASEANAAKLREALEGWNAEYHKAIAGQREENDPTGVWPTAGLAVLTNKALAAARKNAELGLIAYWLASPPCNPPERKHHEHTE